MAPGSTAAKDTNGNRSSLNGDLYGLRIRLVISSTTE
jgi:hypothetical protein